MAKDGHRQKIIAGIRQWYLENQAHSHSLCYSLTDWLLICTIQLFGQSSPFLSFAVTEWYHPYLIRVLSTQALDCSTV